MEQKITTENKKEKALRRLDQYMRIGSDYFKIIKKPDRYGIVRTELKKWKKQEIAFDLGHKVLKKINRFDDFVIEPNNIKYSRIINSSFNMYAEFAHKPKKGDWKWTEVMLKHIFKEQYNIGIVYLQVLYLYPKQALPVMALVSEERQTGKSTFMDWLTAIFGANMVIIDPNNIKSDFNGNFATANIIGIEETGVQDKATTVEKIKSISTQKTITVNMKGIQHFTLPFFGKIIMNSNNEEKFIKIDQEEIRFFIRKVDKPTIENHNILNDMVKEIPAFLYYLTTLPPPDFSKSRMVFTYDELINNSLEIVKEESKSWLYKELMEIFQDIFIENRHYDEDLYVTVKDIKSRYFNNNNQVTLTFIRKVLKKEFHLETTDKVIRYKPFFNELETVGKPFVIHKTTYKEDIIDDDEVPF